MNPLAGAVLSVLTFGAPLGVSQVVVAPATASEAAKTETPSQFYMRYRAAVLNATTLDDVLTYWRTEMANEFKQAPPDQRADLAAMKRIYAMMTDVKVVGEAVGEAGGATVTLEGTRDQKKMTGTAYLVRQNGEWKLFGQERWE